MQLPLETNTLMAGRTCLAMEMNVLKTYEPYTMDLITTVCDITIPPFGGG